MAETVKTGVPELRRREKTHSASEIAIRMQPWGSE